MLVTFQCGDFCVNPFLVCGFHLLRAEGPADEEGVLFSFVTVANHKCLVPIVMKEPLRCVRQRRGEFVSLGEQLHRYEYWKKPIGHHVDLIEVPQLVLIVAMRAARCGPVFATQFLIYFFS